MGVGVGKGGTFGLAFESQVLELAFAALEPVRNLPQAGLSRLTKQDRDKLIPTRESSSTVLRFELADMARELRTLKKRQDLARDLRCESFGSPLMMGSGITFDPHSHRRRGSFSLRF